MQFSAENSQLLQSLVAVIRSASQLNAQDVGFIRTLDRKLKNSSVEQSQRLLTLIKRLITSATGEEVQLSNVADLTSKWNAVDRAFDVLLDKASYALSGESDSRQSTPVPSDVQTHEKSLAKPQESFAHDVDNSPGPFKPKLISKPHAIVGLEESTQLKAPDSEHPKEWYDQPYKTEIEKVQYPKEVYESREPTMFRKWSETPLSFVDTPKQVKKMVSKLAKCSAIAVDLEHHDLRSYMGLLCLMQISTEKEDFIVDTLKLRTELQVLNEVFCNPNIVKVFHGAYMDIQWLQRDLGVYVVNLFDTYHASRALGLVKHSLAFLLQKYADFEPSKQYQRADWRVRPLSQELIDYARADTHFLLYIYDNLRNELLQSGKLEDVLRDSRLTAAKRYEKPGQGSEPGWLKLAVTNSLNPQQAGVMAKLYEWRDAEGRKADESPNYIMSNAILISLSALHPTSPSGVINIGSRVPPRVRNDAQAIADVIADALNHPIDILAFAPTPDPQLDLFSEKALNEVKKLRMAKPLIYSEADRETKQPPTVYLGVLKIADLPNSTKEEADSASEEVPEVDESKSSVESESESVSETEVLVAPKSRKRKIQVVKNLSEVNLQPNSSNRHKLEDQEAFDFESAEPITQERKTPAFRPFRGKDNGPRGARGPRRVAQGRSKTFKK
ncbi:Exosome complex exonuclease RRP6 [Wickerhamiella sorbophila]|uniref:Exosome complex exonuclease RRP6 n=1 Tax=Wickerhamiella sorbophila TaxID=45607 RepID=A0A2T0FEF4_9ASCO|nr:Exosome complex exonuclease RRP6 [Wickerhamiella sorbophila]XP_024664137.1 Exosome complex exonuclease RRP6 [Wickerhamiella sorbophila]PRT53350.1 Exosome complex exonuclease RRP6 [Wickerhamiella sorbophila]PRT54192.1 Exosome complex exonuclease RRP6 [Wickerhamiella sorbophila]